jgi:N-acetylmuramic acid 6-phosphate etherase
VDAGELAAAMTEQSNPRSIDLEHMETRSMIALFIAEEGQVAQALQAGADSLCKAVDMAGAAIKAGGRLFYTGAGTSGRLGVLDASEIPPTFGTAPETVQGIMAGGAEALWKSIEGAEDAEEEGGHAVIERGVRPGDVVCGITASGRTPFALGALRAARGLGAKTILLTCNPSRHRETQWDAEIDLPTGPEIIAGSTRLKAGTATKLALNIISTCSMVRLGRTRGNRMVDFAVSNSKLRDRAVRLVSGARGITFEDAKSLLEKNGWRVRDCIAE